MVQAMPYLYVQACSFPGDQLFTNYSRDTVRLGRRALQPRFKVYSLRLVVPKLFVMPKKDDIKFTELIAASFFGYFAHGFLNHQS